MNKIKVNLAIALIGVLLLQFFPAKGNVPGETCPCVLEPGCGCCPEYTQGSTVWHLTGWECWGSGGECQYRHCIYS